jgi:hypothetical protein
MGYFSHPYKVNSTGDVARSVFLISTATIPTLWHVIVIFKVVGSNWFWKPNGLPDDEKGLYQDSNFYQHVYFSANAGIATRYCMHAYFTFIHWGRSSGYDHFSESNLVSSRYEQERDPLGRHTKWGRGSITRYNPTTFDLRYPWGVMHQRRTVQGRAVQRIKNCAASIQLERWSIFKNIVWPWGGKRVVLCNRDIPAAKGNWILVSQDRIELLCFAFRRKAHMVHPTWFTRIYSPMYAVVLWQQSVLCTYFKHGASNINS